VCWKQWANNGTALLASAPKYKTKGVACLGLRTSAADLLMSSPLLCSVLHNLPPALTHLLKR